MIAWFLTLVSFPTLNFAAIWSTYDYDREHCMIRRLDNFLTVQNSLPGINA